MSKNDVWKVVAGVAIAAVLALVITRAKAGPKPKTASGGTSGTAPDFIVYSFNSVDGSFLYTFNGVGGSMTPTRSATPVMIGNWTVDFTDYTNGVYQFNIKDASGNIVRAGTIDSTDTY